MNERDDYYIWDIRTPRAIGAIVTGAALALAGAVMQNDFKNPLAEPYTMGISSGAFLGACLSIISGFSILPFISGPLVTMANAFVFSLIPTAVIVVISKFKKMTPAAMILTGIAVMFLFSSISQVLMVTAPSESLADAYSWRVGSLNRVSWDVLPVMVSATVVLGVSLYFFVNKLNVMYAGDKSALTLGEDANRIRIATLIILSFMTASVVSFTGTIGFIGLVGPHIARIFVGSNNRYFLPASAAFGAAFILLADTVAKVSGSSGLPVGVISAMVGGPLFIWILIRQRKSAWA
ncbi:ABC-type Fe3+-siderophore transport system, permease component [Thermoplasmatales archaeon BRNA1]|nr:ABC-type Fe3+-siderophore transport system, permease component [Thermoplasmatales archaeon BRNA1]